MAQKRSENGSREKTDVKPDTTDSSVKSASETAEADAPASEAQETQEAQTFIFPMMPETLLALAVPPDTLKAVSATGSDTPLDQQLPLDADALTSGRKSRSAPFQAGQLADEPVDAQKFDAAPGGKVKLQAAAQTATVTAAQAQAAATATSSATTFVGQLAAAHQADTLKIKELPTDLMNSAAMRPATQASFNLPGVDSLKSNTLAPSVGTSAWSQALGDKVVWMAAGAQQTASLTLNPPNMGPLQSVLNITNDQATANFFSAQPEVRQALEAAFPKLREMMNEAGIQLGQATVSAENPRQNEASDRQAQRSTAPFNVTDDGVAVGQISPHVVIQHSGRGLIDTFA
jgi:flagellar hook-length control protein FliK